MKHRTQSICALLTLTSSLSLLPLTAHATDALANPSWSIAVEGLYAKQSSALPHYGRINNTTNPSFLDYPTDNEWGYGVAIGYAFPHSEHDMRLSYTSLETDDSTGVTSNLSYYFPGMRSPDGESGPITNSVKVNSQLDYQAIDLTIGTLTNFTDNLEGRIGYGVSYVNLDQKGTAFVAGTTDYQSNKSSFEGFGPKITGDLNYKLTDHFAFVAGAGASMLFGEAKIHTSSLKFNMATDYSDSNETIAFGVESKAGFRFGQIFSKDSGLSVEVGYKGTTLLNALQGGDAGYPASNNNSGYSYDDNYSNHGAYITIGAEFM